MTAVLLDTHVLLWVLTDNGRLGQLTRTLVDRSPAVYASSASTWELAIKAGLGKIEVPDDLREAISQAGLVELSVTVEHSLAVRAVTGLPHKDPFDHLLLAQSRAEDLLFVTADSSILTGAAGRVHDART